MRAVGRPRLCLRWPRPLAEGTHVAPPSTLVIAPLFALVTAPMLRGAARRSRSGACAP